MRPYEVGNFCTDRELWPNIQNKQLEKAQSDYTLVVSELAVLKSKLAGKSIIRKASKKR